MKLTLGFSPCPNDTFIFDALIHHKIDTEGLEFAVSFEDVETLNTKAFKQELDITKLSFHAFAYAIEHYQLLFSGSALGFGVGPLLISNKNIANLDHNLKVAIPGKFTTASFLLHIAYPQLNNLTAMKFDQIENAVIRNDVDLGVIIHENRFTYAEKGLIKIADLGEFWERKTNNPIPLGGIVVRRNFPNDLTAKINRVLERSIRFAFENPTSCLSFVKQHAQEMSEEVMYNHIKLYVNKYTLNIGNEGKKAIERMFQIAQENKSIPIINQPIFINN